MRLALLILIICIPKLMLKAQPGCGLTCINIKEWRNNGQMVKVEIRLLSNDKKLSRFKVSATDSLVSIQHSTGSFYCKLKAGKKVINIILDSLNCDAYYQFSLGKLINKTIYLIPSDSETEKGCSNRKSILLINRKEK